MTEQPGSTDNPWNTPPKVTPKDAARPNDGGGTIADDSTGAKGESNAPTPPVEANKGGDGASTIADERTGNASDATAPAAVDAGGAGGDGVAAINGPTTEPAQETVLPTEAPVDAGASDIDTSTGVDGGSDGTVSDGDSVVEDEGLSEVDHAAITDVLQRFETLADKLELSPDRLDGIEQRLGEIQKELDRPKAAASRVKALARDLFINLVAAAIYDPKQGLDDVKSLVHLLSPQVARPEHKPPSGPPKDSGPHKGGAPPGHRPR